jgi:hypothetical protein
VLARMALPTRPGSSSVPATSCCLHRSGYFTVKGAPAVPWLLDYSYAGWIFDVVWHAGMGDIGLMFLRVLEPSVITSLGTAMRQQTVEKRVRTDHLAPVAGDATAAARLGVGRDDLPLGAAPVGHLRDPGAGPGAFLVQQFADNAARYPPRTYLGWPASSTSVLPCSAWRL